MQLRSILNFYLARVIIEVSKAKALKDFNHQIKTSFTYLWGLLGPSVFNWLHMHSHQHQKLKQNLHQFASHQLQILSSFKMPKWVKYSLFHYLIHQNCSSAILISKRNLLEKSLEVISEDCNFFFGICKLYDWQHIT